MITKSKLFLTATLVGSVAGLQASFKPLTPTPSATATPKASVSSKVSASSDDVNIYYIDTAMAMQNCDRGKELSLELDKKREQLKDAVGKQAKKLTDADKDFKTKNATMSPAARSSAAASIDKMQRELEVFAKNSEEEFNLAVQQAMQEMSPVIEKIITKIAKDKNADVVHDTATGRTWRFSTKHSMTDDVIVAINQEYAASSKAKVTA